jgi:hypothetical protein
MCDAQLLVECRDYRIDRPVYAARGPAPARDQPGDSDSDDNKEEDRLHLRRQRIIL